MAKKRLEQLVYFWRDESHKRIQTGIIAKHNKEKKTYSVITFNGPTQEDIKTVEIDEDLIFDDGFINKMIKVNDHINEHYGQEGKEFSSAYSAFMSIFGYVFPEYKENAESFWNDLFDHWRIGNGT